HPGEIDAALLEGIPLTAPFRSQAHASTRLWLCQQQRERRTLHRSCSMTLTQAAHITGVWTLVHGFALLLLDGLGPVMARLPPGTGADAQLKRPARFSPRTAPTARYCTRPKAATASRRAGRHMSSRSLRYISRNRPGWFSAKVTLLRPPASRRTP